MLASRLPLRQLGSVLLVTLGDRIIPPDKGTGMFVYQLPIHHWWRVDSTGFGLPCMWAQCASVSREMQISSELP